MADVPDIFSLVRVPSPGTFGESSDLDHGTPCSTCGRHPPPTLSVFEYELDSYDGEQIVGALDFLGVAEDLQKALVSSGMQGFRFREMTCSRGPIFEQIDPDGDVQLPEFAELVIEQRLSCQSGWWTRGAVCPSCERPRWEETEWTGVALDRADRVPEAPVRNVWLDDWNGEDIFLLDDPGPPIVTARFRDVLMRFQGSDLSFQPARFVSRG